VKVRENPIKLERLTEYKQSPRETIKDYGEAIINMVKKLFPNVNNSNDIDSITQECFVEGLLSQRLREVVRAKLFKMKCIKKDETFRIDDLIKYAECKNASYDQKSHGDGRYITSDSDHWNFPNNQLAIPQQNKNLHFKQNFDQKQGFFKNQSPPKQHFSGPNNNPNSFRNQNVSKSTNGRK
jgi:hypothetical protein